MGEASSGFRHGNPIKFGELVTSMRLDYEERCWPIPCINWSGAEATVKPEKILIF